MARSVSRRVVHNLSVIGRFFRHPGLQFDQDAGISGQHTLDLGRRRGYASQVFLRQIGRIYRARGGYRVAGFGSRLSCRRSFSCSREPVPGQASDGQYCE